MMETHVLREQLQRARQEVAHSLYQHDAACRVITKLTRERDDAVSRLESLHSQIRSGEIAAAASNDRKRENGDTELPDAKRAKAGVTPEIVEAILAKGAELMEARKTRDANPPGLATREEVATFSLQASHPLHSTSQGGILALALPPGAAPTANRCIATAGADHTVQVYDVTASRILASLPGHTKKVTALAYSTPELLLSGSADTTVKLWQCTDDVWALKGSLKDFDDAIVRLCVHPVSQYSVTIAANATWHLHDLHAPRCVDSVKDENATWRFTCGQVHPDGALVGIGTSAGAVRIWDIKESKFIMEFTEGMEGSVYDAAFNENGYWLATACDKGVQVWDLRKLRTAVDFQPFEKAHTSCLAWDHSGKYLACGGPEVKIYNVTALKGKKGGKGAETTLLKSFVDIPAKKGASCLAFGPSANSLFVGSSDHNLRVFGR